MIVTTHAFTARPVAARPAYPPVSVPRKAALSTTVSPATISSSMSADHARRPRPATVTPRYSESLLCDSRSQMIACVRIPETRYARTVDGLSVAYQVMGDGPPDVVLLRAWHTNVEYDWEERVLAHVFQRIASFGRLILFDRRGTGLSDRIGAELPTLDQRMDDILAVLDAVGSSRAALVGLAAASMLTATFAASYPERTQALVLHEPHARGSYAADYPWAATVEQTPRHRQAIERGWGFGHLRARTAGADRAEPGRGSGAHPVACHLTAPQRASASRGGAGGYGLPDRCPSPLARRAGADAGAATVPRCGRGEPLDCRADSRRPPGQPARARPHADLR
jgi:pimeloyl-ACP methyl ester carboxylesterase